jgi:hypothetical protein
MTTRARSITRRLERILDRLYVEPDAFLSAEEFERAYHDDIPVLTLDQIDAERILARVRWALTVQARREPSAWLLERLVRLDQAAGRLRAAARKAMP